MSRRASDGSSSRRSAKNRTCLKPSRRFAILANAAAGDKPRSWLAAKIAGAFSFAHGWCLVATGGRTSHAGIPRGEDQPGRHGGHPRLGARSGRKTVQARHPAVDQPARGADHPGSLRRRRRRAGGVRRGDARRPLRHRARPPRRTDAAAGHAQRRRDVRSGGRDPRVPRPRRSQDVAAAGGLASARLDGLPPSGSRTTSCPSTSPPASSR